MAREIAEKSRWKHGKNAVKTRVFTVNEEARVLQIAIRSYPYESMADTR
jgi:hypothetical protein